MWVYIRIWFYGEYSESVGWQGDKGGKLSMECLKLVIHRRMGVTGIR